MVARPLIGKDRAVSRSVRRLAVGVVFVVVAVVLAPPSSAQDATTSTTYPDPVDAVVVGSTVDAAGDPIASVPIVVHATDTGSRFAGAIFLPFFFVATLGLGMLDCVTGGCFDEGSDETVDRTASGADGRYSATLPESFVPGLETDTDWIVGARLPTQSHQSMGATSSFEFEVNNGTQDAGPLPMWDVDPQVEVNGWAVSVSGSGGPRGSRANRSTSSPITARWP